MYHRQPVFSNTPLQKAVNLSYYLIQDDIVSYLDSIAEGSTSAYPSLTPDVIADLEISLPPLSEQEVIASILSSLDDKIDLLQRQNKTLEKLAEMLFRQSFTEESCPVGKVSDLIEILSGFAFKSTDFRENGSYRLVTIKNVQDGFLDLSTTDLLQELPEGMPTYCQLQKGDILLSLTGNVGRCCLVTEDGLLLNQRVAKLEPKEPRDFAFAYTFFRLSSTRQQLEELAKGTAQPNLSPIETKDLEMPVPQTERLESFAVRANALAEKILDNYLHIRTLTRMRDTLLPKLMSGEVRVKPSNEMKEG